MPDYPISEEALEAAFRVLYVDRSMGRPVEPHELTRQAINAFLVAEGFEVEIDAPLDEEQRLVGPWRPTALRGSHGT